MNPLPKLNKSLREKIAVKFLISQTEDEDFFGVVVRVTPEFVALRQIHGFEGLGIVVFRLEGVGEFVEDGNIRCANRVLRGNGQLAKLRPPKWLDKCDTMEDIFHQLNKRDIWPSIDVKEGEDEWFLIGPITRVEPEGIIIRHYDAHGTWDRRTPVGLPSITTIRFDYAYAKHFGNYKGQDEVAGKKGWLRMSLPKDKAAHFRP